MDTTSDFCQTSAAGRMKQQKYQNTLRHYGSYTRTSDQISKKRKWLKRSRPSKHDIRIQY